MAFSLPLHHLIPILLDTQTTSSDDPTGGILWDWSKITNIMTGDNAFNTILVYIGSFLYRLIIIACFLFAGIKLVTSFINFFSTPENQTNLRLQYKNDIKEVFSGTLMLFGGVEMAGLLINAIFPDTKSIITPILTSIKNKTDASGLYSQVEGEIKQIIPAIKYLYYGIAGLGLVFFSFKIVMNIIGYFRADDTHTQTEYKNNIKNNFMGLILVFMAASIVNILLTLFGYSSLLSF